MREALKSLARVLAWLTVTPSVLSWQLRARMMGADRALEGSTQVWALVPGLAGQYLRRAFLSRTLPAAAGPGQKSGGASVVTPATRRSWSRSQALRSTPQP